MNEALVVCVRGIISFFTLLIFTRILGKQQIGQITFFDYIVGITIGSFAASLTIDLCSAAWPHWVGLLTWCVLGVLLQIVSLKSKKVSQYINDEPTIIVHNGKVIGDNLKNTKFTLNELLQQLRLKDIFDINDVKLALIEMNGQLSILKCSDFDNIVSSMNIPVKDINGKEELIFNGIVINENLAKLQLNRKWLDKQLAKQGYDSSTEVFYAYIDFNKNLKVDGYNNRIIRLKDIFK